MTMHNRRWITRTEIAEIHEQRARIREQTFARESLDPNLSAPYRLEMAEKCLDDMQECLDTAGHIRDIAQIWGND